MSETTSGWIILPVGLCWLAGVSLSIYQFLRPRRELTTRIVVSAACSFFLTLAIAAGLAFWGRLELSAGEVNAHQLGELLLYKRVWSIVFAGTVLTTTQTFLAMIAIQRRRSSLTAESRAAWQPANETTLGERAVASPERRVL